MDNENMNYANDPEQAETSAYADPNVQDESEKDQTPAPIRYDISSYGADYDVDGVVKRLKNGDIFIPPFQRDYVWNMSDASKFVESLLLGLPVPGVFLAKEPDTNKLLVIDGQQRLKSLQFFYEGVFKPNALEDRQRVFKLTNVQERFEGRAYNELESSDKIKLNDSIIHATIIKQEYPREDDTSIYYVFERLNKYGRKVTPQEIRSAIYHGQFIELLNSMNAIEPWRNIYGKRNLRLKDQELILRFLALYYNRGNYAKPMENFLTKFCESKRFISAEVQNEYNKLFTNTITMIFSILGPKAFKPERALNTAIYDSVMVGIAEYLNKNAWPDPEFLFTSYNKLLANAEYKELINSGTSDDKNVSRRMELSISHFTNIA